MIDYEVKIFNDVHSVASPLCAKNRFVSVPIEDYTKLPAGSLYEMDNSTVRWRQTSSSDEEYALITYQLDVVAETKSKCRQIYAAVDGRMIALNFSKMSGQFITYPDNPNIVRYTARYEAMIDKNGNLYRRL